MIIPPSARRGREGWSWLAGGTALATAAIAVIAARIGLL